MNISIQHVAVNNVQDKSIFPNGTLTISDLEMTSGSHHYTANAPDYW